MTNNIHPDMLKTTKLRAISMSEMVYGPRPRRVRFPSRLIFVVALLSMYGCATAPRPVTAEVETVGTLSASYNSIASAPVHASTDLTPAFGAVDSDEDAPVTVGNGQAVLDGSIGAPEVAQKHGLVVGEAR
jgi:hypothetical protein